MIILTSLKTNKLKKKEIINICKLKNLHCKTSLKSQLNFFDKNLNPTDIHNLLFFNKKLVGYTCLRKKKFFTAKKNTIFYLIH